MASQCHFLRMPPEVRTMIYKFVFAGSRVHFMPEHRRDRSKHIVKGQSDAFKTVGSVEILYTCRACYAEGRAIFWDEAVLHAGTGFPFYSKNSPYILSECISNFTKVHVRHLRGICPETAPERDSRYVLCQFPGLRTVSVLNTVMPCTDAQWRFMTSHEDKGEIPYLDFITNFPGSDAFRYLRRHRIEPENHRLTFLQRILVNSSNTDPSGPMMSDCSKVVYINVKTKKIILGRQTYLNAYAPASSPHLSNIEINPVFTMD